MQRFQKYGAPTVGHKCVMSTDLQMILEIQPKLKKKSTWTTLSKYLQICQSIFNTYFVDRVKRHTNENYFLLCRLLDPNYQLQYNQFKKVYADILYQWELLNKRAEILKYVSGQTQQHKGVGKENFLRYWGQILYDNKWHSDEDRSQHTKG